MIVSMAETFVFGWMPAGMPLPLSATRMIIIGQKRHFNFVASARHRFVTRIIEYLPDEMVQAVRTGGADVHSRRFRTGSSPSRTVIDEASYAFVFNGFSVLLAIVLVPLLYHKM